MKHSKNYLFSRTARCSLNCNENVRATYIIHRQIWSERCSCREEGRRGNGTWGGGKEGGGGNCLPGAGEGGGGHGGRDKPDSLLCLACLQLWFIHREEGIFLHLSNALSLSLLHTVILSVETKEKVAQNHLRMSRKHMFYVSYIMIFSQFPPPSSPPQLPTPHLSTGEGAPRVLLCSYSLGVDLNFLTRCANVWTMQSAPKNTFKDPAHSAEF